jgi:hypothetical protein
MDGSFQPGRKGVAVQIADRSAIFQIIDVEPVFWSRAGRPPGG